MAKSTHKYDIKVKRLSIKGSGQPIDISPAVTELSIFESIWHPFLTAHIRMSDSHNLHQKLDNMSETATVDIDIINAGLESLAVDEKDISLKPPVFHINQTSARAMTAPKAQSYTLDLVSESYRNTIDTKISETYKSILISDMVDNIYNKYFRGIGDTINSEHKHDITCEPTDKVDTQQFTSITPLAAINDLAKKAVSEDGAVNYLFFETINQHFFVSINTLLKDQEKENLLHFTYKPGVDDSTGVAHMKKNVITVDKMQFQQQPNHADKIANGTYGSKLITHDIVTKVIRQHDFNMFPRWSKLNHCGDHPPTSNSEVETAAAGTPRLQLAPGGSATTSKLIGDQTDSNIVYRPKHDQMYCNTYTEQYDNNVENWYLQRNSDISLFTNGTMITLETSGHTGIRVGMVIWLELLSPEVTDGDKKTDKIIDKRLSGKWLVTSIKHIIGSIGKTEGTTYNMIIEVTRDGVSACVPDRPSRKEE